MAITAVQTGTNGALLLTAQALYPMVGPVLDLTPGEKRGFWTNFTPDHIDYLVADADFRTTGLPSDFWDHVVFDPPYVAPGGRATSTLDEMNDRYGMQDTAASPWEQWNTQIVLGVCEAHRLLRPKGLLWFKVCDYVSSGKVHWFTKHALPMLNQCGFDLVDEFILAGHTGPQPLTDKCKACDGVGTHRIDALGAELRCPECNGTGSKPRRQVHARKAHSNLLIARKRRSK